MNVLEHIVKKIIIASNNHNKIREIKSVFKDFDWEILSLSEAGIESDPVEDADSFEGNARIKAKAVFDLTDGVAALADDSGLVVDALNGEPGVYSSRYAGCDGDDAANNAKLLSNLRDVDMKDRTARFVCTLVFIDADGTETVATGSVEGNIGFEERGAEGFGYDPLFYPDEFGGDISFAEVPLDEKNKISHRARALRSLKERLRP